MISRVIFLASLFAAVTLVACSPRPGEPATPTANVQSPLAELKFGDWGPKEATQGVGANVQPDGVTGVWIMATGVSRDPATRVTVGGVPAIGPVFNAGHLTIGIPKAVIDKAGDYELVIEEPGRSTTVGVFKVRPAGK